MMTNEPKINIEGFGFQYKESPNPDQWAIRDIHLRINEGEIALVLGRSGCGKSTLGLAVAGIIPNLIEGELEGSVRVSGLATLETSMFEMSKHVGVVFQDPEVQLFALTVEDEVAMSLESYGLPRARIRERVDWALGVCGLSGLEMRAPAKLSGGQKQRVAIAAVLARDPEVLVFDEPTGNLDPVSTRSVYQVIQRICTERRRTVLLIEHDLAPVIDFVHRVIVLEEGKVIFEGTPRQVLAQIDLMYKTGAKVPVATQLALQLEKKGLIRYEQPPLLPEESARPILQALGSKWPALSSGIASGGEVPGNSKEPAAAPLVSFQSVTYTYPTGQVALDNLNLEIRPGEFVGILGMNGAGKTTLALHVMGILKPTSGKVFVHQRDTSEMSVAELAKVVGLIFQNPNHQLFKDNVEKELRFGPENLGWDEARIEEAMRNVLSLVGLSGLEKLDPEGLSTGQKKRVAIASTLIMDPKILLLDEPTTGQDQRTLQPILDLVSYLHHQGMTVLMITHDMEIAMKYADRVVVLANGKIIADGPPCEVFMRDDVLEQAELNRPELLQLTAALNSSRPLWIDSFETLEERISAALRTG